MRAWGRAWVLPRSASAVAWGVTLAASLFVLLPASARAFITVDRFDLPVVEGGGGGLRFTGSRADARTCAACHASETARSLSVAGLPAGDPEPGRTYELSIDASGAARSAFALELEGLDAAGVGVLDVPDPTTLAPDEQCSNGVPATSIVDAAGSRRVAVAAACGARRYRVLWTAPTASAMDATLTLHGGVVLADDSGGPTGDTAVVLDVPIGRDARERAMAARSSCAVYAPGEASDIADVLFVALLLMAAISRRRGRGVRRDSRKRRAARSTCGRADSRRPRDGRTCTRR